MGLLERIRIAIAVEKVEYWEGRKNPPNLSRAAFDSAFTGDATITKQAKKPRDSAYGTYCADGEDRVHDGELIVKGFGSVRCYYFKLFFWKKTDRQGEQGIEVQSFRELEK